MNDLTKNIVEELPTHLLYLNTGDNAFWFLYDFAENFQGTFVNVEEVREFLSSEPTDDHIFLYIIEENLVREYADYLQSEHDTTV